MPHLIQTPFGVQLVATEALPPELQERIRAQSLGTPDELAPGGGGGAGLMGAASALGDAMTGAVDWNPAGRPGIVSPPPIVGPNDVVDHSTMPSRWSLPAGPGWNPAGRPPIVQPTPVLGPTDVAIGPVAQGPVAQGPRRALPDDELFTGAPPAQAGGGPAATVRSAVTGGVEPQDGARPAARRGGGGGGPIGRLREGVAAEERGMRASAAAEAQLGARIDETLAGEEQELTARRAEFDERSAAIHGEKTRTLAELRQAEAAFQSTPGTDPHRLFRNQTTEQKIMGAVGLMLGSIGAAINKTSNTALEIMDRAVQRDIQAQRDEYEQARDRVDSKRNLYAFYRQQGFDEQDAFDASVKAVHDSTALRLDRLKAQASVPQAVANLEAGIGRLRQKSAEIESAIVDRAAARELQRQELAVRTISALSKGTGRGGKPLAAELTKQLADNGTARNVIGIMQGEWGKVGMLGALSQYLPLTDESKYRDAVRIAAQQLGRALEGGKLTDADYETKYIKFFPSPGETQGSAANKFRLIERMLGASQGSLIETAGRAGYNVSGFADLQAEQQAPRVPAGAVPIGGRR